MEQFMNREPEKKNVEKSTFERETEVLEVGDRPPEEECMNCTICFDHMFCSPSAVDGLEREELRRLVKLLHVDCPDLVEIKRELKQKLGQKH